MRSPMEFGLAGHCLVKINETLAIAIGGRIGHDYIGTISSSTFFYSWDQDLWLAGPELQSPREGHACGAVQDSSSEQIFVVTVGGFDSDQPDDLGLDTSEILTIRPQSSILDTVWTTGPKLHEPIHFAAFASVDSGSRLMLLGGTGPSGYLRTIYEWKCSNQKGGCEQMLLSEKLPWSRSGFVVTNIDAACSQHDMDFTSDINFQSDACNLRYLKKDYTEHYNQQIVDVHAIDRGLCCQNGNLCHFGDGSCLRDADCAGDLVCGCQNCNTSLLFSVFNKDDNCCAETRDSCSESNKTVEPYYQNESDFCIEDQDCIIPGQKCIGDCKVGGSVYTCCANSSVQEPACGCSSTIMSVKGITCSTMNLDGSYIRFAPSIVSWSFVQLGNYNSKLFLEHLTVEDRYFLTSLFEA